MSARALTWCWAQTPKTTTEKLVLAALADRADDDGECFPSIEWVAAKCRPMTRQTAKRALASLAEQGMVAKTERRRRGDGTLGTWLLRLPLDIPVVTQMSPVNPGATDHQRPLAQGSPVIEPGVTHEPAETTIETTMSSTDVEDGTVKSKPKSSRRRDELWDTFVEVCGYSPTTRNGRGKWNAGIAQLREAGATAETLAAAIKAYRKEWPDAEVSPTAIASWWDRFAPKQGAAASTVDGALAWAQSVGWRYDGSALDDEVEAWVRRGVDETLLREAVAAAKPIAKLAATA